MENQTSIKSETPSFGRRLTKDAILGDVLGTKDNTKIK